MVAKMCAVADLNRNKRVSYEDKITGEQTRKEVTETKVSMTSDGSITLIEKEIR